ncbi:hypothetical protein ACHAW6_001312 [Cyclotella cf. meneghiniana]
MIFDVKIADFSYKAQLVAEGHITKAPATLTYASVMSRETMRIAQLVAALNDIDIWTTDVLNAYISALCHEIIWTPLGKEFGDDYSQKAVIVPALYGLRSSSAAVRAHLAGCLLKMGGLFSSPTLTYGSKNRQTGKAILRRPVSSVMLTTCLWSTIIQDVSWTRLTASFLSSLIQVVSLRCILGLSPRIRPIKTV